MQVLDELKDIVAEERGKLLVFATHHPFRSTGLQSGYYSVKQHIFPFTDIRGLEKFYLPLPGIGSLYPVTRGVSAGRQDM
ncbi:hypothetical protein OFO29_35795, partial [Escherichia coli]|nr:hypothetical protein [Escherichia coli]